MGRAIYVVDMQTGTLLRRFVTYINPDGDEKRFETNVIGSPAMYNAKPGSLATRAFVGDASGRLFRIDLSDEDPEDWQVDLFFDPADLSAFSSTSPLPKFGPAAFKPALARASRAMDNDLLIYYGLGERGDLSTTDTTQIMIALRENFKAPTQNGSEFEVDVEAVELWAHQFQDDSNHVEKLTSEPVVFNRGVYFTSFVEPADDRCQAGWSRIYGMHFEGGTGLWTDADLGTNLSGHGGTGPYKAYEPSDTSSLTEPDVVRGLTITLGASCLSSGHDSTGGSIRSSSGKEPTLIAQSSSGNMDDGGGDSFSAGSAGSLHSIEKQLGQLESQNIPLSWAVIDN